MDSSTVVDSTPVELTAGFAALADPVRLRLIGVLADGGRCVCDLQEQVPVAPNLMSYHLRVLRKAGLVTASKRGRWVDYRLDGTGFAARGRAANRGPRHARPGLHLAVGPPPLLPHR